MISVTALRTAEPDEVAATAWSLRQWAERVEGCEDEARRWVDRLGQVWSGQARDRAGARLAELRDVLAVGPERLRAMSNALDQLAQGMREARAVLAQVFEAAGRQGFGVGEDGTVTAGWWPQSPPSPAFVVELAETEARRLTGMARNALETAGAADARAAGVLRGCGPPALPTAVPALTLAPAVVNQLVLPGKDRSPAQVRLWWESLTPEQRRYALERYPERIGALDGIPCVYRDEANRAVLGAEKFRLQLELASLRNSVPTFEGQRQANEAQIAAVEEKLKGVAAIETRLNSPAGPSFLLGFDTRKLGHAIVAVGNPDEADNVVTYVPGTGARLGDIEGDIRRADMMAHIAHKTDPEHATAVITWVGYDAPQLGLNLLEGPQRERHALDAEPALDRFQDGLRATHDGASSRNTVLGHSYGSTVIGFTARDRGLDVDSVVFVGSPGVGVERASDLGVKEVWSTSAEHDLVGRMAAHGPSPTAPEFQGRSFPSDPGTPNWPPAGLIPSHSEYWEKDSKSLKAIGKIATGGHP